MIVFVRGFRRGRAPREFVGLVQSLDYLRCTLRWATHLDPPRLGSAAKTIRSTYLLGSQEPRRATQQSALAVAMPGMMASSPRTLRSLAADCTGSVQRLAS